MTRSERGWWRAPWVATGLLAVSTWSIPARGAEDEAAARALFSEGRRLAAAGDYVHACPKFEDSYRLDPGIGTSFNLADCLEHLGRTASAWARFLDVAAATKAAGQIDREQVARARAAALEPRLARLTVVVSQPVDGLVVRRDATVVGEAALGVAVPVDPGLHTIEATAPHRKSWSSTTNVLAAAGSVSVEVPPLSAEPDLASSPAFPTVPMVSVATGERSRRRLSAATVVVGAAGVVALTAGTIFGIKFESANKQLPNICASDPQNCAPTSVTRYYTLRDEAVRDVTYEFVGLGVGGAAVLTAAFLWWRSASPAPSTSMKIVALPSISPEACGLNVALHL
jgi:tetratricopeptide (TPR) repeat protein